VCGGRDWIYVLDKQRPAYSAASDTEARR
jgi:hypothetical protein